MKVKHLVLIVLVGMTSTLVLVMRYSRLAADGGVEYLASTAVVAAEAGKLLLSTLLLARETRLPPCRFLGHLHEKLIGGCLCVDRADGGHLV